VPEPGLLLVHALAPPTPGGTPVILHRLLGGLEHTRLDVLTDRELAGRVRAGGPLVLPARYRWFRKLRPPRVRLLAGVVAYANALLAVIAGLQGAADARRGGTRWILSVVDGGFSPIAGAIAARLSGRPHLVMAFDLWEENAYSPAERRLARLLEPRIMGEAAAVVVYCENAADHYRAKHGATCAVIATPIDVPDESAAPDVAVPDPSEVLVAGAVYWAQEDAVRRLVRAARSAGATVTILGDEADLRRRGIDADRYEPPLEAEAFRARLRRAGMLFLGLSLDSPHPDVIRTATPARLVEYMASGRPLLVHAPADSHVAGYARSEDFAEVVDSADDDGLAAGIRAVAANPELARERAARARRLAEERHSAPVVRREFRELLEWLWG
jgi:glycosyltransferase involved in cell wall biosynthesis